ncbi:hypothetical protein JB92DRAFT_3129528 [Gautieria morchelliformis]|nr:hypothetical protein JB92DRAFT_3129528 [Gautieria morchelliformis]
MIQKELDELRDQFNNHVVRKINGKVLPSGVSPNIAYVLPDQYGGENHLQPIDKLAAQGLMEAIGGKELIQFVSEEYASCAAEVFHSLGVERLTMQNVWVIFKDMLPLMHP